MTATLASYLLFDGSREDGWRWEQGRFSWGKMGEIGSVWDGSLGGMGVWEGWESGRDGQGRERGQFMGRAGCGSLYIHCFYRL